MAGKVECTLSLLAVMLLVDFGAVLLWGSGTCMLQRTQLLQEPQLAVQAEERHLDHMPQVYSGLEGTFCNV